MSDTNESQTATAGDAVKHTILNGVLCKLKRDNNIEKRIYYLTADELLCYKFSAEDLSALARTSSVSVFPPPDPHQVFPLKYLMALPLNANDRIGKAEAPCPRTFKLLTPQKSYYLKAPSTEQRDKWVTTIQDAAKVAQTADGGSLWDVSEAAPIRLSAGGINEVYEQAMLQNILAKRNRKGAFERNVFVLAPEELVYFRLPTTRAVATMVGGSGDLTEGSYPAPAEKPRVLRLSHLVALPLSEEDKPGSVEECERTFKVLSRQKSFFLRAPTLELKDLWLKAIHDAASAVQMAAKGMLWEVTKTAPIYMANVNTCQVCKKNFSFIKRKSHCHNCGNCVCHVCSHTKMRILKLDTKELQRVCNPCCTELKGQRVYGVRRQSSSGLEEVIRAAMALASHIPRPGGRSRSGSVASQQSSKSGEAAAHEAESTGGLTPSRPGSPAVRAAGEVLSPGAGGGPASPFSGPLSVTSAHSQSVIEIDI